MKKSQQFLFNLEENAASIKKKKEDFLKLNSHAQKMYYKVEQLLLKSVENPKSKLYFLSSFYPTTNLNLISNRQEFCKKLFQYNFIKLEHLSSIASSKKTFRFPFECYTNDSDIHTLFSSQIPIFLSTEKEIRALEEEGNFSKNTFIISDERYLGEIEQLRSKELAQLIQGYQNANQIELIAKLHHNAKLLRDTNLYTQKCLITVQKLFNLEHSTNWNFELIEKNLNFNVKEESASMLSFIQELPRKVELKNKELQETIKNVQMQLQGDDLVQLLESNNVENLQKKIQGAILDEINIFEETLYKEFQQLGFSKKILFESKTYPLKLNEESMYDFQKEIDEKEEKKYLKYYLNFSTPSDQSINEMVELQLCFEILYSLQQSLKQHTIYASQSQELLYEKAHNLFIKESSPITYGLNTSELTINESNTNSTNFKFKNEKVSILTGANSGGKTTLLELILTNQILFQSGLPLHCKNAQIPVLEEIIYLKKFTGTQGSGAFEQTIRELLQIISTKNSKLLLIDEFEAITEPGAAASILTHFLSQISNSKTFNIYCVGVSHLGKDIKEFILKNRIDGIRIDGISAIGLDEKGNLITNHQPIFNELGKSTPELILKKIYNDESFFKNKPEFTKKILTKILNTWG
ncbi:MAG: AAA family ATPase [Candidatus Woesearchaeota archaeon]